MLKLYSVYHLNMMYSSIEEVDRPLVIEKCYWPLLNLADSGVPLGIELSVLSLKIIQDIDPSWVSKLQQLISDRKVELVGSGYAQIIGPLVPHEVNRWNQKLGMDGYDLLLGVKPKIALVNEMAYSASMISHYLESGYRAIIMEWNNPRRYHQEWEDEWRYHTQLATNHYGEGISILWADSIVFQKFQRCAHQELKIDDLVSYLSQQNDESFRYLPLYTNDAEIFGYRPNRYRTEAKVTEISEWAIINKVYSHLQSVDWAELVLPSTVLNNPHSTSAGNRISLESTSQPIPVKKQEKYNIIRWALSGRNDLMINTNCYQIYRSLINKKYNDDDTGWKELCYLWSSDFRTHITKERWTEYLKRMNACMTKLHHFAKDINNDNLVELSLPFVDDNISIDVDELNLKCSTDNIDVLFNMRKGLTVESCSFKEVSPHSLFGTLQHGYYDDLTLSADYYSGHSVIELPGEHKITDLNPVGIRAYGSRHGFPYTVHGDSRENSHFKKSMRFNGNSITINKSIHLTERNKARIHPIIFTFSESAWDRETLYYSTHNGHSKYETFDLGDTKIDHARAFSLLVSSQNGLGATGGVVEVGDQFKKLTFSHDQEQSALIPQIVFRMVANNKIFLRLIYSSQEIDDTSRRDEKPCIINTSIKISAEKITKLY